MAASRPLEMLPAHWVLQEKDQPQSPFPTAPVCGQEAQGLTTGLIHEKAVETPSIPIAPTI